MREQYNSPLAALAQPSVMPATQAAAKAAIESPIEGALMQCVAATEELTRRASELHQRLVPVLAFAPPAASDSTGNRPTEGGSPIEVALYEHRDRIVALIALLGDLNNRVRV